MGSKSTKIQQPAPQLVSKRDEEAKYAKTKYARFSALAKMGHAMRRNFVIERLKKHEELAIKGASRLEPSQQFDKDQLQDT